MAYVKNYGPEYQCLKSSDEIIHAIEELYGEFKFDSDGEIQGYGKIFDIWAGPTNEQIKQVEALAWSVASKKTEELWWGDTEIKRPK